MTTQPTTTDIRPRVGQALPARQPVSFLRTVHVELRKMVDTLAGRWLIIVTLLIAALIMGAFLWFESGPTHNTLDLFSIVVLPFGILLPVIGVMAATAEWSQRAGLVTFTLEPRRWRVIAARVLAGSLLGLVVVAMSFVLAYVIGGAANLLGGSVSYGVDGWLLFGLLVMLLLTVVQGIAFGFLFLNTPAAIVAILALPMIWQIGGQLSRRVMDLVPWLDLNVATQLLESIPEATGRQWAQLGTAVAVGILLPLAIGSWRVIRGEVK
ncbi:MAG: ABC transporter permease [Intrasporangiaceae bacterium]|nr:ABC transporter permease [Intrasporangiaceae bacterium]